MDGSDQALRLAQPFDVIRMLPAEVLEDKSFEMAEAATAPSALNPRQLGVVVA